MAEQKTTKIKKRVWYPIYATGLFNDQYIGETLVYSPEDMVGKNLTVNLTSLTNDIKKQNINLTFKVEKVEGSKGKAVMVGYSIVPSSVKRLVRRSRDKMDLSFVCKTADNILVRVKPLLITKANAKGSVVTKVRVTCIQSCTKAVSKLTYEKFIEEILSRKFQEAVMGELKKIYPLKICEIRVMNIVPTDKKVHIEKIVATEAVKEPEEAVAA